MAVSERVPGRHDRLGVGYQETRQIAQRPPGAAAAVLAAAEALPFGKHRFDAAMALWTIHHWADPGKGVAELRRVARRVVIVAASERLNQLWLIRDYFPAIAFRRPEIQPGQLAALLGGNVRIEPFPVPRDCLDGFGEAFWARPEAYLDPRIRAGNVSVPAPRRDGDWPRPSAASGRPQIRDLGRPQRQPPATRRTRLRTPADRRDEHRCRGLRGQAMDISRTQTSN